MGIVDLALRRPYTFIVLAISIVISGGLAILRTPKDIFPSINIPVVSVIWTYAGMEPNNVANDITTIFEREVTTTVNDIEHIESESGRLFSATVVATAHAVNLSNRAQLTELQVSNPANELWPGAYTHVHFHLDNAGASLFIPSNTLIFQREGPQVGVVTAEGKVLLRKIQIAQDLGAELEIVKGLSATDQVIVNPSDSLSNGIKVHVVGPIQSSSRAEN